MSNGMTASAVTLPQHHYMAEIYDVKYRRYSFHNQNGRQLLAPLLSSYLIHIFRDLSEHFPSHQNKNVYFKKSIKTCILIIIDYFRLSFKGLVILLLQSTNFQLYLGK